MSNRLDPFYDPREPEFTETDNEGTTIEEVMTAYRAEFDGKVVDEILKSVDRMRSAGQTYTMEELNTSAIISAIGLLGAEMRVNNQLMMAALDERDSVDY